MRRINIYGFHEYKSEGERHIGDFLEKTDISFEYERPTLVLDNSNPKIWYPDFTLTEFGGILIEYFGMNGLDNYNHITRHKLQVYELNRLDVIAMYPRDFRRNWKENLLGKIYRILDGKIERFNEIFQKSRKIL